MGGIFLENSIKPIEIDDDYDYNLSFADEKTAVDEELAIFNLLNEEDK